MSIEQYMADLWENANIKSFKVRLQGIRMLEQIVFKATKKSDSMGRLEKALQNERTRTT